MSMMKYRIFISDYQPFRYYHTLRDARNDLRLKGYCSFESSKWDSELGIYTGREIWILR